MSFVITASSDHHGSIYPVGSVTVVEGADQSFTITSYSGYTIGTVLVDGVNVGAVSSYTFSAVAEDHTIAVDFIAIPFSSAQFRIDFPEFADTTKYPDSMVNFWSGMASTLLHVRRWGSKRPYGLALFTAHMITLQAQNQEAGEAGNAPGTTGGVISAQSAGPISESIDTQSSIELDGGSWNLTTYGKQYLRLARMAGIGGIQV